MTFLEVLFSFQGRIGRATYWLASVFVLVCWGVAGFLAYAGADRYPLRPGIDTGTAVAMIAFLAVMVWMNLAIMTKRWHDRGKSGWWYFICLVPIIGGFWMMVELGFLAGEAGVNRYGAPGGGNGGGADPWSPAPSDGLDEAAAADIIAKWKSAGARAPAAPARAAPVAARSATPVIVRRGETGFGRRRPV